MAKNVFVVEDHDVVRESFIMLIEMAEGLSTCGSAATAEQALSMLDTAKPDLVLVDLSLPNMSGLQLVSRIKADYPELKAVVVTAHGGAKYRRAAEQAGADAFVTKQEGSEAILSALSRVQRPDLSV